MPDGALALRDVQAELPGIVTEIGWQLPRDLTERQWSDIGRKLGRMERSVQWWIGEWWMYGETSFHGGKAIVTADDWEGPSYGTCKNAANCCRKFPKARRRALLSFSIHLEAASLPAEEADAILNEVEQEARETGKTPPTRAVRTKVKSRKRAQKEQQLGEGTKQAAATLGELLGNVIYVDPPWRFEPYSRETGMDRAADNHYPTTALDELAKMKVPAMPDCIMFMWATVPMLDQAIKLLGLWGFTYKSNCVWIKDKAGTGYWFRNRHELLLVGTRGQVPAPAPGEQYDSVIELDVGVHSAKPEGFAEMIEDMFPNAVAVEMFARAPRLGWKTWGNELANAGAA
jgi:N6-adenosine-specific RNA methylase IME4